MARDRERGAVRDGFTVVGRRPRGAAPGNIVTPERADEFERNAGVMEDIWGDRYADKRASRLRRTTTDVDDDEPYLDYQG